MKKGIFVLLLSIVLFGCVQVPTGDAGKVFDVIDFSFDVGSNPSRISFGLISGGNVKQYQTFVAGSLPNIYQVDVMVRRYSTTSPGDADVVVELYAVEDFVPVGQPLATASAPAPASHVVQLVSVPLSYEGLEADKVYAIVLTSEKPVETGEDGSYMWVIGGQDHHTPGTAYGRFDGTSWVLQEDPLKWPPGDRWLKIYVSN